MIKVLHTSDWHLGKKLFKKDRFDEQELFLNWITKTIEAENIDLLLVAGDIFDVPMPPTKAMSLYYDFLHSLGKFPKLKTIIISGNHDSKNLLKAPKAILQDRNCEIFTDLDADPLKMNYYFEKNEVKIAIKLLPYFRNYELLNATAAHADNTVESFFKIFFNQWTKIEQKSDYKILMSHHGFGKYSSSGSEHAIFLSGLEYFPLDWVNKCFDYVALGHIHQKQTLQKLPPIVYTGSPIPMRFSENNDKYISIINITKDNLDFDYVQIPSFRNLISISCTQKSYIQDIESLLANLPKTSLINYLEISIQMEMPEAGIADKIRILLKGTHLELISYIPQFEQKDKSSSYEEVKKLNITELFNHYYKNKYQTSEVPKEIQETFHQLIERVRDENTSY